MFKHDQYSVLSLTRILQTQTTLLSQSKLQDEFIFNKLCSQLFSIPNYADLDVLRRTVSVRLFLFVRACT